jgi:hypothetical protein
MVYTDRGRQGKNLANEEKEELGYLWDASYEELKLHFLQSQAVVPDFTETATICTVNKKKFGLDLKRKKQSRC